jgi:organic radical activating enzyme
MKLKYKILRWGLLRRLTPGVNIGISLTYRCNYNCSYCAAHDGDGKVKTYVKEMPFSNWLEIFDLFPYRIKMVCLSGGEPTLYKEFLDAANYILDRGWFLMIFTNLSKPDVLLKLKPSYRLKIKATYHRGQVDLEKFKENLAMMKDYNIDVHELETNSVPGSIKKRMYRENRYLDMKLKNSISFSPDGNLYLTCADKIYSKDGTF